MVNFFDPKPLVNSKIGAIVSIKSLNWFTYWSISLRKNGQEAEFQAALLGGLMASLSHKPGNSVRIDGNLPSIDSHFLDHDLPIFTQILSRRHCGKKNTAPRYRREMKASPAQDRAKAGADNGAGNKESGRCGTGDTGRTMSMRWSETAMGGQSAIELLDTPFTARG